ncbi:MAG: hypothetical protein IJ060_11835 [Oscillospiraceae bacterium]|nr:hypothetical protein [Oscillospiraceae bacterium]
MQIRKHTGLTLLLAGIMAAGLSGCSSDRDPNTAEQESSAAETTTAAAAEPEETATSQSETTTETAASAETETTAASTAASPGSTNAPQPQITGADDDTRLLWSERGLEAVTIDSTDGYGEDLAVGSDYLNWTLNGYDGSPSGDAVPDMKASFTYNGQLQQNGQIRVLSGSDAHYPNGLYMHVDNIADFPYFPKDTRDRGWFVIQNADEVLEMLGLESPAEISGDLSVAVTVDSLYVHVSADDYDTLHVVSATRR